MTEVKVIKERSYLQHRTLSQRPSLTNTSESFKADKEMKTSSKEEVHVLTFHSFTVNSEGNLFMITKLKRFKTGISPSARQQLTNSSPSARHQLANSSPTAENSGVEVKCCLFTLVCCLCLSNLFFVFHFFCFYFIDMFLFIICCFCLFY